MEFTLYNSSSKPDVRLSHSSGSSRACRAPWQASVRTLW